MQLPIRSCLFFPFGQASPVPLCRHYPCFPLRGEWRKAPREVSLNSALFSSLVLAHFSCEKIRKIVSRYASSPCLHKIFSHFVASPCLIVLAHNEAKIVSLVPRLPLASSCLRTMRQKLSALFQGFPSGGGSLRSKVVRAAAFSI